MLSRWCGLWFNIDQAARCNVKDVVFRHELHIIMGKKMMFFSFSILIYSYLNFPSYRCSELRDQLRPVGISSVSTTS